MATEVSIFYTDTVLPWFQTATFLEGFIWCEDQNGNIIWGSPPDNDNWLPVGIAPNQSGDTNADIAEWIEANIEALSTIAPSAWSYGTPFAVADQWGINAIGMPNTVHARPFVALGYTADFTFGDMNVPASIESGDRRVFKFAIWAGGAAATTSPAKKEIDAYVTENETNPILWVLELHQE